jgi:hypothetical protein
MSASSATPTASLTIKDPDDWEAEARAFAAELEAKGERPWFEVRWPAPPRLTPEEEAAWLERQEDTYDALELVDGELVTLPPYAELIEAAS